MVYGSSNNSRLRERRRGRKRIIDFDSVDFPSPTVVNSTTVRVGRKIRRSIPCRTIHAPFKPQ
jgi:hypothetical protein